MAASAAKPAPSSPSFRASSLSEGVIILLALTIVQRLVGFARGILFCKYLDPEQLGRWDLSLSFLMLAAPVVVFGLPACFGRYVESYRQSGQLRTFLRRTSLAAIGPAAIGCTVMALGAPWFALLLFGTPDAAMLVTTMAAGLGAFIAFNYLTCLFTALRSSRMVSYMQFSNSVLFAVVSLGLAAAGYVRAEAAVAAFGIACLVSSSFGAAVMVRLWRGLPLVEEPLAHRALWTRLMPFAFWIWLTNWLTNLFEIADRYLIVHYGGLSSHDALALVGQYHSARVVPFLMIGLADMLSTLVTPHLAGDWEAGRRDAVAARLRLVIKLFLVLFLAGSIVLSLAAPLFFHTALNHKFGFGEAIFPWTLACALWTGLGMISQNWLWCAERTRMVCIALAVGLLANIGLNLALLPSFGLQGVVAASAVAKVAALVVIWGFCLLFGMRIDGGLVMAAVLPALLLVGPWYALAALIVAASGSVRRFSLFSPDEQRQVAAGFESASRRFRPLLARFGAKPTGG